MGPPAAPLGPRRPPTSVGAPLTTAAPPFRLLSPIGLACLVVFLHYVGAYMRMPLLPLYASAGGAGTGQAGVLMGTFRVVAAASSIPGGVLADRFGRRRLMAAGVAISTVTSFLL